MDNRVARMLILGSPLITIPVPAWAIATSSVGSSEPVRLAVTMTLLAVIPAVVICMTSFVRIVIVLSMVRHAFGMPETPPNAVIVSLSLFLTVFSMGTIPTELNQQAITPYLNGQISFDIMMQRGSAPLRDFMLTQTRDADIETIYAISNTQLPQNRDQVDILKLTPAFMLNELRVAFTIGFVILLPFLLIDLVVSAVLLALGMMMVPPATISLPIKLLMFVLIDGWALIIEGLLGSFG